MMGADLPGELHDDAWPESVMKINNNIRNQVPARRRVFMFGVVVVVAISGVALRSVFGS